MSQHTAQVSVDARETRQYQEKVAALVHTNDVTASHLRTSSDQINALSMQLHAKTTECETLERHVKDLQATVTQEEMTQGAFTQESYTMYARAAVSEGQAASQAANATQWQQRCDSTGTGGT